MVSVAKKDSVTLLKKMLERSSVHTLLYGDADPNTLSPLTLADVEDASALSGLVGWRHSVEQWEQIVRVSRGNSFCLRLDNTLVGTAVCTCYGSHRARLSDIIIHPDYQRRGLGRRMVKTLLDYIILKGVDKIDLDASDGGKSLYETLGFHMTHTVETWVGGMPTEAVSSFPAYREDDFNDILLFDYIVFGAPRGELYRDIIDTCLPVILVDRDGSNGLRGFLFAYQQGNTIRVGPWMHRTEPGALSLLEAFLSTKLSLPVRIDVPVVTDRKSDMLSYLGFTKTNEHIRMVYSAKDCLNEKLDRYYGMASMNLG